jgi:hypothetical protein
MLVGIQSRRWQAGHDGVRSAICLSHMYLVKTYPLVERTARSHREANRIYAGVIHQGWSGLTRALLPVQEERTRVTATPLVRQTLV